jgi:hypothetical protein
MGLAMLIVLNNIPSAENSIILCVVLSIPHRIIQQPKMVYSDPSTFIVTSMCSSLRHRDPNSIYQTVTDISPRTPGFNPRVGHVGFLVHRVALEQVSLRILQFSCHFPPILHTHISSSSNNHIRKLSKFNHKI